MCSIYYDLHWNVKIKNADLRFCVTIWPNGLGIWLWIRRLRDWVNSWLKLNSELVRADISSLMLSWTSILLRMIALFSSTLPCRGSVYANSLSQMWTHKVFTPYNNSKMVPLFFIFSWHIAGKKDHENSFCKWPVSSDGQSVVLITPRSWVQSPYWPMVDLIVDTPLWLGESCFLVFRWMRNLGLLRILVLNSLTFTSRESLDSNLPWLMWTRQVFTPH